MLGRTNYPVSECGYLLGAGTSGELCDQLHVEHEGNLMGRAIALHLPYMRSHLLLAQAGWGELNL